MVEKMKPAISYESVKPNSKAPFPGILASANFFCSFGYRVLRPFGSKSWLLFYSVSGEGLIRQPGVEKRVHGGDVDLLAPDAYSDYGVPPPRRMNKGEKRSLRVFSREAHKGHSCDWSFHWVHFQAESRWAEFLKFPDAGKGWGHTHIQSRATRKRIQDTFLRLHRDRVTGRREGEMLARTALEEILLIIHQDIQTKSVTRDQRIARALKIIESNIAGRHSVESLAGAVDLSPSRFAHLFKAETGDTITHAILRMRMRQAERLLIHTGERVSDIAYLLGFKSPFYFSRQFKAFMGMGPRAFRQEGIDKR